MSTPVAIPRAHARIPHTTPPSSSSASAYDASTPSSSIANTPEPSSSAAKEPYSNDHQLARSPARTFVGDRRPSLLSESNQCSMACKTMRDHAVEINRNRKLTWDQNTGSSIAAQEHTVINVGHPDGPPRLVSSAPPLANYPPTISCSYAEQS
jgi:hypothetical protein